MIRTIDALIVRLADQNVGVGGTTIFAGSDVNLPNTGVPAFITLAEAGGPEPTRFHNTPPLRHPSIQLTARGDLYDEVAALLEAAWDAVGGSDHPIVNMSIGGVFFLSMYPVGEPLQLPVDAQQRVRLAFNIAMTRR